MEYKAGSEIPGPYREMEVEQCLSREPGCGLGVRWVLSEAAWAHSGPELRQSEEL